MKGKKRWRRNKKGEKAATDEEDGQEKTEEKQEKDGKEVAEETEATGGKLGGREREGIEQKEEAEG